MTEENIVWDTEQPKMRYVLTVTREDGGKTKSGRIVSMVHPDENSDFQ